MYADRASCSGHQNIKILGGHRNCGVVNCIEKSRGNESKLVQIIQSLPVSTMLSRTTTEPTAGVECAQSTRTLVCMCNNRRYGGFFLFDQSHNAQLGNVWAYWCGSQRKKTGARSNL